MSSKNSNWGYALVILLISGVFFLLFKSLLPKDIIAGSTTAPKDHIVVDEWMQKAMEAKEKDSILRDLQADEDSLTAVGEDTLTSPPQADTTAVKESLPHEFPHFLNHFYAQLEQLEQHPDTVKVRIAYFGDSMNDGDLIVQDVRRFLQKKYGGKGVGFIPVTSESATSRISIIHRFSKNWQDLSFMKNRSPRPPYGIHGHAFYAVDSLSPNFIKFRSGQIPDNRLLPYPTLLYGRAQTDSAQVEAIINSDSTRYTLHPKQLVNELRFSDNNLTNLEVHFYKADSLPLYGVNFDTPYGIQVDNFSKRGNSGLPLSQLSIPLMNAFQQKLHYDLIVLQYGTNVLSSSVLNYGWYGTGMGRVIQHLRAAFPEASILLISIADKATKYDTTMQTDSAVNPLLNVQKNLSIKQQTGFINLYELMGGEGSMIKWAEKEPPLANKDYTHFSPQGSRVIAQKIFEELEKGFEEYKINQQKKEEGTPQRDSIQPIIAPNNTKENVQDSTSIQHN